MGAAILADTRHLHRFEASMYSQNGEDGIIKEVFRRIGTTGRNFVEIGAADGSQNCTRALVEEGWAGVWIEGDPARAAAARAVVRGRPVAVVDAFVDRDSIVGLLAAASATIEPDLLVIDVDGNDYWVWQAVAERHRARVVVIEYNATVGPWLHWVLPYNAAHRWDQTARHGAGLAPLAALGSAIGYTLVGCDSFGVNAFFVRTSEAGPFTKGTVREHWVPPRYQLPFGHPWRRIEPFDARPVPDGQRPRLQLEVAGTVPAQVRADGFVYVPAGVANGTDLIVGESAPYPVRLVSWWLDADGKPINGEPVRTVQPWRADPAMTANLRVQARAPAAAGRYQLVVGLVQESVCWFDGPSGCRTIGWWEVR